MMKVFLDTNILIDLICSREGFVEDAERIFQLGYEGRFNIVICALSFVNTFYTGKKYKFDSVQLQEALENVQLFCEVSPIDEIVVRKALSKKSRDFEDEIQIQSAEIVGADVIVTRNPKDFTSSRMPVYVPKEFLCNI